MQTEPTVIVVVSGIYMWALVTETNKQTRKHSTVTSLVMQRHVIGLELTFTGLHAFRPFVINILAAKSSTAIEPSTARSATTDSTGFLEHSTLWTRYVISDR